MNPFVNELNRQSLLATTRRQFLGRVSVGIGGAALASLLNDNLFALEPGKPVNPLAPKPPHFPAKAKRAIYIHMAGSPSHLDLFDPKPKLMELNGQPCPESLYKKERFAFIKGVPKMLGSPHKFKKYGECGMEMSELLPHIGSVADDICLVRSMHTDQFNHSPAQVFIFTGSPRQGRPGMGAWLTYGLGSESQNLPGFVVLVSGGKTPMAARRFGAAAFCRPFIKACNAGHKAIPCSMFPIRPG
jgi:hypothetical protein